MKKLMVIIFIVSALLCTFTACSSNSGSEVNSTTAITDVNGETHYYETITDENGEVVIDKDGNCVTKENTTVFNDAKKDTSISEAKKTDTADNEVTFSQKQGQATHATDTTVSTTEKETTVQSVTDKDGWINKWY